MVPRNGHTTKNKLYGYSVCAGISLAAVVQKNEGGTKSTFVTVSFDQRTAEEESYP
jgi:hypothetical protein